METVKQKAVDAALAAVADAQAASQKESGESLAPANGQGEESSLIRTGEEGSKTVLLRQ